MIIDTHTHYDDDAYDNDRDKILILLKYEEIAPIINVAASMKSVDTTIELSNKYEHVYAAIGVHPSEVSNLTEKDMEYIKSKTDLPKVVAIGEIGLDYHYDEPAKDMQEKWFIRQLELAKEVGLPVIIHSRDAAQDTFNILNRDEYKNLSGIIHCYSYSAEMAKEYVKMGYYIGVGGVVTFKNGKKLHQVVREIPIERIVLETDCPYLSPEPYRGRRNSSAYLTYVIERIAELKGIDVKDVERITYENALSVYRINN